LVAEKERMLALLEQKRAALISRAVTRGLNPKASTRPSGPDWLGEIPKHWKVQRCATLFVEKDERGEPELPLLNVSLNTGVTLRVFSEDKIESMASDLGTMKIAREGDLVFNKMRFWQGAAGIAPADGLVSPDYTVATISDHLLPDYVEKLFPINLFNAIVRRYSYGMVDDRLRLYWDEFKNIRIPIPPLAEQEAIIAHIRAHQTRAAALESALRDSIALLKERRSALITAAVTGRLTFTV
jgi:type I restriction enzyme S subunit